MCKDRLRNNATAISALESVARRKLYLGIAAATSFLAAAPICAAPNGGLVVGGQGSIEQASGITTVSQQSDRLAIDWASFDVSVDERVDFLQPTSSSIVLNRILSHQGTEIHGRINANGHVFLVNPNGVFFGEGSRINVGGLLASGLNIDPADFMNGDLTFSALEGTSGTVVSSGIINAATGGSVALLGKHVQNSGLISANLGAVTLAAGNEVVLTFDPAGLIGVKVSQAVLQDEVGVDAAVINSGEVIAQGGRILLNASTSQDIFSRAVNHGEMGQASSVLVHEDGTFTLGPGSDVVNTGTLNVSAESGGGDVVLLGQNVTNSGKVLADGLNGNGGQVELHSIDTTLVRESGLVSAQSHTAGTGGSIQLLGNKVGLMDAAEINASGVNGGGQILIGGDESGQNARVRNADFIYLSESSAVRADAVNEGDGGRVIGFANDTARFYGSLSARGGAMGGDGGFVETSGLKGFDIQTSPDVSASQGNAGTWLIDPYDIDITGSGTISVDTSGPDPVFESSSTQGTLDVATLLQTLNSGGRVIVRTAPGGTELGNITVDTDIEYTGSTGAILRLEAHNNITFDRTGGTFDMFVTGAGALNLELEAGGVIDLSDSTFTTNGGYFQASSAGDFLGANGTITTTASASAGDIFINAVGNVELGNMAVRMNLAAGQVPPEGGAGGDVIVFADGNITLHQDFDFDDTGSNSNFGTQAARFELNAGGNISINATILDASPTSGDAYYDTLDVILNADSDSIGGGAVTLASDVYTAGGNFTASGAGFNGGTYHINTNNGSSGVASSSTTGGNVVITSSDSVTLGSVTTKTADVANAIEAGDLEITASATVSQDAGSSLLIEGDTTIDAVTGNISLLNANNVFKGLIGLTTTGDVAIENQAATVLGDVNVGSLDLGSGGEITQASTAELVVAGATTLSAGNGVDQIFGITLVNAANDFQGLVSAQGPVSAFSINDVNALQLGAITSTGGDIDVDAVSLTVSGNLTTDNSTAAGAIWLDASNITLDANLSALGSSLSGHGEIIITGTVTSSSGIGIDGGAVSVNGDITTLSLDVDATSFAASNIRATGLAQTPGTDANGNPMFITPDAVSIDVGAGTLSTGNIDTSGSLVTNGGNISLLGDTISVGALVTDATANIPDALAGDITITATSSATLTGDVRAFNGDGTQKPAEVYLAAGASSVAFTTGFVSGTVEVNGSGSSSIGVTGTGGAWTGTGAGSWMILSNGGSGGQITANGMASVTGSAADDLFTVSSSTQGAIDGGGPGDSDTVDASALETVLLNGSDAGSLNISNIERVQGSGSATSTLGVGTGNAYNNTWTISDFDGVLGLDADGQNDGEVELGGAAGTTTVQFLNFANLQGGAGDDSFILQADGNIDGLIDGGVQALEDTLTVNWTDDAVVEIGGNTSNINITNIEQVNGDSSNTNTLLRESGNTDWNITGNDVGNVVLESGETIGFSGFANLTGGAGADRFIIGNTGSLSGVINGGASPDPTISNTIQGPNRNIDWTISGQNAGQLVDTSTGALIASFDSIQNLVGGTADDTFVVATQGSNVESVVAGTGQNIVDLSQMTGLADATRYELVLSATGVSGWNNISRVIGRSDAQAEFLTLAADTGSNDWVLGDFDAAGLVADGINDGTVALSGDPNLTVQFVDIANVSGGSGDDAFILAQGGNLSGLLNGGGQGANGDILTIASTDAVTVALGSNVTTNLNVADVETIVGNSDNSTLLVADGTNSWVIDNADAGHVTTTTETVSFEGFDRLNGGSGVDTFEVQQGGSFTGFIDGGASLLGEDSLLITTTDALTVELGDSVSSNLNINNIERVQDQGGSGTLYVASGDNTWLITDFDALGSVADGQNDGTVTGTSNAAFNGTVRFVDFANLAGGSGNDTFTLAADGNITGLVDGGSSPSPGEVDIFNLAAGRVATTVQLGSAISSNIDVNNFEQLFDLSGNATLGVASGDNTWTMTAARAGSVSADANPAFAGTVAFAGFAGLQGSPDQDTLVGAEQSNSWTVSGTDAGLLASGGGSIQFSGFENLTGGVAQDQFTFGSSGRLSGRIDGGTSAGAAVRDELYLTNLSLGVSLSLGQTVVVENGTTDLFVTGVEHIVAPDSFTSYLTGASDQPYSWVIDGVGNGTVAPTTGATAESTVDFFGFANLRGGANDDRFLVTGNQNLSGSVHGGDGEDLADYSQLVGHVDISVESSGAISGTEIDGVEGIIGNSSGLTASTFNSRIRVGSGDATWTIGSFDAISDGVNDVTVEVGGTVIRFENFNILEGGSGAHTFEYQQAPGKAARLVGYINGGNGGGADSFDASGSTEQQIVRVQTTAFDISSAALTGGTYVHSLETITGNVNTNSTLVGPQADSTWTVPTSGLSDVNSTVDFEFTGFANLIGGSADDSFYISNINGLNVIDGGASTTTNGDSVDLVGLGQNVIVGIGASALSDINLLNIEDVSANDNQSNTLVADNVANNTWTIIDPNEGTLANSSGSITFSGFANLTGRELDDTFNFFQGGAISGIIDGGAGGANTVDLRADTGTVYRVELGSTSIASNLKLINMSNVMGNGNAGELIVSSANNAWRVMALDSGDVNGTTFSAFASLTGGGGNDSFTFESATAALTGTLDGGGGTNTLTGRVQNTDWHITGQHSGHLAVSGQTPEVRYVNFENIQILAGRGAADTLIGRNQSNRWVINQANGGSLSEAVTSPTDSINFSGMENLTGGNAIDEFNFTGGSISGNLNAGGGNDILALTSSAVMGSVNGGLGDDQIQIDVLEGATGQLDVSGDAGNNTLTVLGGGAGYSAEHRLASSGAGELYYAQGAAAYTLAYSGMSSLSDDLLADSLRIASTGNADTFNLSNNAYALNGFTDISFGNKNNLLIAANTNDAVAVNGTVSLPGTLTIQNASVAAGANGLIAANTLRLEGTASVGSSGQRLSTDIGQLAVQNGRGDIFLLEQNGLNLMAYSNTGSFDVQLVNGNLTSSVGIASDQLFSANALNGDLLVDDQNSLSGNLSLMASGAVVLNNTSTTNLSQVQATSLTLDSDGDINGIGPVLVSDLATFDSGGELRLENAANDMGRIQVGSATNVTIVDSNTLTLDGIDASGAVQVTAGGDLTLEGAVAGSSGIQLGSNAGSIVQRSNLDSASGDIALSAAGDIRMEGGTSSTTSSNLSYEANNLFLASLSADHLVLNARGSVSDNNGPGVNLTARRLDINAQTGIGAAAPLDTMVSQLYLSNNTGATNITNARALTIGGLRSNGDVSLINSSGDVYLDNSDGALYSRGASDARSAGGTADANYQIGNLLIDVADGDLLAISPVSLEDPLITARNATLVTRRGGIGQPVRPLILYVQDRLVLVSALPNWVEFAFGEEPANIDDSQSISGDTTDLLASGNEQMVEIEGLEDVDPAIFTNVRNYAYDDISILLPRDQLYFLDDDDDE